MMRKTVFLVLILALASVRSEYTWNGQEWVWSEDKNVRLFKIIYKQQTASIQMSFAVYRGLNPMGIYMRPSDVNFRRKNQAKIFDFILGWIYVKY